MGVKVTSDQALPLTGRRAIVTGAGSPMGRAIAEALVKAGAGVALIDDDVGGGFDTLESVDALCEDAGVFIQCDFCSEAGIEAMVEQAVKSLGGVDILINSVTICDWLLSDRDADSMPASGVGVGALTAVYLCMRYVGQHMKRQQTGFIVNIGSLTDTDGHIHVTAGGPALAALRDQSNDAAARLSPYGVSVRTLTAEPPVRAEASGERISDLTCPKPYGLSDRCSPDDVAAAVLCTLIPRQRYSRPLGPTPETNVSRSA